MISHVLGSLSAPQARGERWQQRSADQLASSADASAGGSFSAGLQASLLRIGLGRLERSPFGGGFCRKMQHAEAMSRMQAIVRPAEHTKIRGIAPPLARKRNDVIDLQKCAFIATPPLK